MPWPTCRRRIGRCRSIRCKEGAMMIRDMMPGFDLYQPTQLNDALALP